MQQLGGGQLTITDTVATEAQFPVVVVAVTVYVVLTVGATDKGFPLSPPGNQLKFQGPPCPGTMGLIDSMLSGDGQ